MVVRIEGHEIAKVDLELLLGLHVNHAVMEELG